MARDVNELHALCQEYLDACQDAIATTLGGRIDRAYVSPGPPAWDCPPQLTVHAGGPVVGDTAPLQPPLQPGERAQEQGLVTLVTMTATILRCSPVPSQTHIAPSPQALAAAAQECNQDVWAVWIALIQGKRDETVWAPKERPMFLDPGVAVNTQGGVSGWQLQVRVGTGYA